MNLFPFFNEDGFSNSYILAAEKNNCPCVIFDPSDFTLEMLQLTENRGYRVEAVFLTHYNRLHVTGLTKLSKIYRPAVYTPRIGDKENFDMTEIGERKTVSAAGIEIRIVNFLGDFGNAVFYRVGNFLFTGDLYQAGDWHAEEEIFTVNHAFIVKSLRNYLCAGKGNPLIYPGFGAPTSFRLEFPECFS